MKVRILLIISIIFCLMVSIGNGMEPINIRNAVLAEVKKYPKLEIQDLYKLAYQAAMGNEHIMDDTTAVINYLEEEYASVDSSSQEPLLEYLSSDSTIARVNLRTFKSRNLKTAILLDAMLKTAKTFQPSINLLNRYWEDILHLAKHRRIPFRVSDLKKYFSMMKKNNFPAVHHSNKVNKLYQPAYRIVNAKYLSLHK